MIFEKHIFTGTNKRSSSNLKDLCVDNGMAVLTVFVKELQKRGLKNNVWADKGSCLDAWSLDPVVVIYNAGICYKMVPPENMPVILEKSIIVNGFVA